MTNNQPNRMFALAGAALVPLALAACGGGSGFGDVASNPNPPAQCATTGTCPPSGFEVTGPPPAPLCAASLDYTTVFTGGSGAGEYLKMKFDTAKKTYELQIIESPVPKKTDSINPTRAGVTFKGTFENLTTLPSAEQNRCAIKFVTATASDGTSQAIIDSAKPPIIFLGNGVAGGGIPGATVEYGGFASVGVIPTTSFPMYPVLAFAETESDFSKVNGTFNLLGFHMVPSGGSLFGGSKSFTIATASVTESLAPDGSCSRADGSACVSTGSNWRARGDGAFDSTNAYRNKRYPSFFPDAVTPQNFLSQAKGIMVVGKLQGKLVPLVIRVGYANPLELSIDDESGIALMAPNTALTQGQFDGGYVGSGSDFKYTASLVKGSTVSLVDPLTVAATGRYQIDWTQKVPGLATTLDDAGKTGQLIGTGPVFATLSGDTFRISVFASN